MGLPPLSGIRVLDFSRMLSGPFCTALLADLGAEVIKVEAQGGDDARHFAPRCGGESAYFMLVNRNKKSIVLDLKTSEGKAAALDLAGRSDILVENFKPGVAERLGIGYETLRQINPRLIYASISGFGQEGPLAARPAYDIVAQAMSGMMSINGSKGAPPTRVGESMGDLIAGLYASWAINAALHARNRDGVGQYLDVAMVDSMFSMLLTALTQFLFTGQVPGRVGNSHPISAPLDTFAARDGLLIIAVANDALFRRLAETIGKPELADDARFSNDIVRKQNETMLKAALEEWTSARTVDEAVAVLDAASIPASPVLSLDQVVASEHAAHRGLVAEVSHPTAGIIPVVRQPVKFSGCDALPLMPPPLLGQHTRAILDALRAKPEAVE